MQVCGWIGNEDKTEDEDEQIASSALASSQRRIIGTSVIAKEGRLRQSHVSHVFASAAQQPAESHVFARRDQKSNAANAKHSRVQLKNNQNARVISRI